MKRGRYFYFHAGFFSLLAALFLLPFALKSIHSPFSAANYFPSWLSWVFFASYFLFVPSYYFLQKKWKGNTKTRDILVLVLLLLSLLPYIDFLVLGQVSAFVYVSKLSRTPDNFVLTCFYLVHTNSSLWGKGILSTLEVSFLGTLIGFLFAVLLAFLRTNAVRRGDREAKGAVKLFFQNASRVYISLIRGTPMMLQGLIIYYLGLAIARLMFPNASIRDLYKIWSFFTSALITVSMNSAAYLAEVLRGGIDAVSKGQKEAASSLGLTPWQTLIHITFPQALKTTLPSLGNEFISNIKSTSVLSIIGFVELMSVTTSVAGATYKSLETYAVSALFYYILTFLALFLVHRITALAKRRNSHEQRAS